MSNFTGLSPDLQAMLDQYKRNSLPAGLATSGPAFDMSKSFDKGLTGGKDGMKASTKGALGAGTGLAADVVGGALPNTPLGSIGKVGLGVAGGIPGGPAGMAVGGGMEALQALMGGKDGQKQKVAVPQMSTQMGQIGDIYG
jgi:hypothetical protein